MPFFQLDCLYLKILDKHPASPFSLKIEVRPFFLSDLSEFENEILKKLHFEVVDFSKFQRLQFFDKLKKVKNFKLAYSCSSIFEEYMNFLCTDLDRRVQSLYSTVQVCTESVKYCTGVYRYLYSTVHVYTIF